MHNPEADPEHEVARGQDVEEDHQAGRHHSVPGPAYPRGPSPSVSLMSGSGSGVCVSGSDQVITVTTGTLVTGYQCTVYCSLYRGRLLSLTGSAGAGWGVAPVSVWNNAMVDCELDIIMHLCNNASLRNT